MLTLKMRHFVPALVVLGLAAAYAAHANPFYAGTAARSAAATTTLAYITAGNATTTAPVYDSYEQAGTNQANSANTTFPNEVTVAIQGAASSTATVVNTACEYSMDAIDWYQNDTFSTSTNPVNINTAASFTFSYASSTNTLGGAAPSASFNRFSKAFTCPVVMRYVRTVTSVTGAGAGIWTTIIPKKQRN